MLSFFSSFLFLLSFYFFSSDIATTEVNGSKVTIKYEVMPNNLVDQGTLKREVGSDVGWRVKVHIGPVVDFDYS